MRVGLYVAALALTACATRYTPGAATRGEIEAYVKRAATIVATGGGNACTTLQQPAWFAGEWYIFVLDGEGRTICHPARPQMVGNLLNDLVDANGKRFGDEFMSAAQRGGGWVDYVWPQPGESIPTPKSTYVMPIQAADGKTYIVGSGGHAIE